MEDAINRAPSALGSRKASRECRARGPFHQRRGADLDLRGWKPNQSAREIAREMFEQFPEDRDRRRIVELCGMDPDAVLAEGDARPEAPPV
jgi:hypothetical protein